ncbi:MgtC/SapB family protein [Hydrogenophaga sp.]|uniref:MgtC/SapB family protein n=1 Tax=Hydrogenophaga sp. TaxID=1904254 RepID=UPI002FCC0634
MPDTGIPFPCGTCTWSASSTRESQARHVRIANHPEHAAVRDRKFLGVRADHPRRVVQGLVSGIGFPGAVLKDSDEGRIHGLITAATIWAAAAVGIAAGPGRKACLSVTPTAPGVRVRKCPPGLHPPVPDRPWRPGRPGKQSRPTASRGPARAGGESAAAASWG